MADKHRYKKADSCLLCPGCNIFMVRPIYMCSNGHNCCEDCKYTHPCKICDEPVYSKHNYKLELQAYRALFNCRWNKSCNAFGCRTIRAHEAACQHRIYKCPALFCDFNGYFSEIPVHIDLKHPYIQFHPFSIYRTAVKKDHMWFQMSYYELFVCKFYLNRSTASWIMHLQAPFCRARELEVELEIDRKKYMLNLTNCFGPTYEIELTYDVIPSAEMFEFTLKVSRVNNFIV